MNASKRWLTPASLTIAKSILSCSVGILFMGTLPSASLAADTFNAVVTKDKPGKGPKNKTPKKPPPKGSAETPSERDHRLWRECRGKPNAGACEGFAS
jgi:hypothetical protein